MKKVITVIKANEHISKVVKEAKREKAESAQRVRELLVDKGLIRDNQ